ncbi:MAG: hypothetical protein J6Y02_12405 [Pseudobutyrivibrio sp.]|nr:hypothetical protein [Pseudobutyrivibrio sp.]
MSEYYFTGSPDYLEHHGILGMKWGVRRFQNPDGSLTPEGRARYGDVLTKKQMKNYIREYNLRTGSNKEINKNTVFKTPNGMYDYKGRKLRNADVEVENPTEEKKTKSDAHPTERRMRDMTDEELKAANERMKLEEDYLKHIANLNPKKVSLGQQFANNLKNELMTSIPKGISGMIENAIKNAGNTNPKSGNEQKNTEQKKEKTKPEEPKTTQTAGVNPDKLNDKDLADYVQRMTNLNRATEARKIFDDEMTKAGEEFMQDYWAKDDKNNRSFRLVERSLADQEGIPLNPDDIRYRLEDKKHK